MKAVQIHPLDDMAIALVDLDAGSQIEVDGRTLRLVSPVHAKHKVYLHDLPAGSTPRLYGMPAGRTTRAVREGEAASPDNLEGLRTGGDDDHPKLPAWLPPDLSDLPRSFQGYLRPDGRIGTRNHLLVTYTVPCVRKAAERVAAAVRRGFGFEQEDPWVYYAREGQLPPAEAATGYPGIDEVVVLHHESGCGTADRGDPEALLRFLSGYITHPNVAGAVVLGLGCEKTTVARLKGVVGDTWKPVVYLEHQTLASEAALMRQAIDALKEIMPVAAASRRKDVPVSALVLGTKCGGSDGFSGITANPALGVASELVAAQQGTVLLPEVPEMFGAETLLAARAVNEQVAQQVVDLVRGYAAYALQTGTHPSENPSSGNIREGLTTIQIKSLGAIQKAGSLPVCGVIEYAEPAPGNGLYLLNTPGYDILSASALPASGANMIVFTTGLGTPFGNPIVPVIKAATNHRTAQRMADIIDFDAGDVLDGEPLKETGRRLYRAILDVASGHKTANERLGHRESAFWNRQVAL